MHIVCPHCSTSYAINPSTLGAEGRTVRCSRCKEVWLARPEQARFTPVMASSMASGGNPPATPDDMAAWGLLSDADIGAEQTPMVESPSIASEWPASPDGGAPAQDVAWTSLVQQDNTAETSPARPRRLRLRLLSPTSALSRLRMGKPRISLPILCAATGALAAALMIWRVDVVRLLPQTASFYKLAGLEVNLRGLEFKDVKLTSETVDGKPVLVIEGIIVGESHKVVELPRLRFSVLDDHGTEIYAWNAVLEQTVLKPGEKAWFRSRLASPPPDGRNIDVRFFSRRDIAAGGA
jgi:predicted Zn finger-like uncharacterized protein